MELSFRVVLFVCRGIEQSETIKCNITKAMEAFSCAEQYGILMLLFHIELQHRLYTSEQGDILWLVISTISNIVIFQVLPLESVA
jgi:hypothetical protein